MNRQTCLDQNPIFPVSHYNADTEEEAFRYPTIFATHLLTLPSKTFKGHIQRLGPAISHLIKELDIERLYFLGAEDTPWLFQQNDHPPVQQAQEYLIQHKIGKRFNGALQVHRTDLFVFIKHLGWLTRCNAAFPTVHFTDPAQKILGHVCKYGTLHMHVIHKQTDDLIRTAIAQTAFQYLNGNQCYNLFGKTSVVSGRKTVQSSHVKSR